MSFVASEEMARASNSGGLEDWDVLGGKDEAGWWEHVFKGRRRDQGHQLDQSLHTKVVGRREVPPHLINDVL